MSEPCPGGLSQCDRDAVPGHTMAGLPCLLLLSASLASLLSPGGTGKHPSTPGYSGGLLEEERGWGAGVIPLNLHSVDSGCLSRVKG